MNLNYLSIKLINKFAPYFNFVPYRKISEPLLKQRMFSFYSKLFKPGDLVFDVGANIGSMTGVFLDLGAKVVSVEPEPQCAQLLINKYEHNPLFVLENIGLSEETGELYLNVVSGQEAISTFSNKWINDSRFAEREYDNKIEVKVSTFKNLVEQYGLPKYCKIDVEGFEYKVIKGMRDSIPEIISIEYVKEFHDQSVLIAEHLENKKNSLAYNFTRDLSFNFISENWMQKHELFNYLEDNNNSLLTGDIFIRRV